MYIIIVVVVIVVVLPLFYYFENKRVTKLRREKAEGKWDFIDREYLPYLASHNEPVKSLKGLSFSIKDGFNGWTGMTGVLHYNPAGLYCEFDSVMRDAPVMIFVWGKDKPSRFSPAQSWLFHSAEMKGDSEIILHLMKVSRHSPDYTFTIKKASAELFEDMKRALGPGPESA